MDHCPVCGYLDLENRPQDSAICACCGTQFGYHDARISHEELRNRWVSRGCPWSHPQIAVPANWSPSRQLDEAQLSKANKVPLPSGAR